MTISSTFSEVCHLALNHLRHLFLDRFDDECDNFVRQFFVDLLGDLRDFGWGRLLGDCGANLGYGSHPFSRTFSSSNAVKP